MEYSLEAEPLDLLLVQTWAGWKIGMGEPENEWLTNSKSLSEKWSIAVK